MKKLALASSLVATLAAGTAHAGSTACGTSTAGWNVPAGAAVFSHDPTSMVAGVMTAIGEYRTHVMLAHGPNGDVSQADMREPAKKSWPDVCSTPLTVSALRYGYPGPERVANGAIYTDLLTNGAADWLTYQQTRDDNYNLTTAGSDIVNWLSNGGMTAVVTQSQSDSSMNFYRYDNASGSELYYSLYQFKDLEGDNDSNTETTNNGMVCSTFISHVEWASGNGTVHSHTYDHSLSVAAGDAIYSSVHDSCMGQTGFWSDLGAALGCVESAKTICGYASNQVRNCMAYNGCSTTDSDAWDDQISIDVSQVATTISPDTVAGQYPADASVWSLDFSNTVKWNQPGQMYACWY